MINNGFTLKFYNVVTEKEEGIMKKITSLSLGISFLIMSYSGIILFIAPHGRISKWLDWHLLGLNKTQYQELHTTSMVIFLLFGLLHIYFNWKSIMCYMKDSSKKISFTKKEFLIALLINIIFVTGSITLSQPFKGFLDFGDSIKDSWGQQSTKVISKSNEKSIEVSIKPPPEQLGRKTLQELNDMGNIDLKKAITILESKGLHDIDGTSRIKPIANELELTPTDIYKLLTE